MIDEKDLEPTEESEAVKKLLEMDPLEVIKASAEGIGLILKDPKSNCKHCHGRGWIGRNTITKEPIPCSCIFPKINNPSESGKPYIPQNRAERRAAIKNLSNKQAENILKNVEQK